jgi:hypothetical protein
MSSLAIVVAVLVAGVAASLAGCPYVGDLGPCENPEIGHFSADGRTDPCHCDDPDGGWDAGVIDPPAYCEEFRAHRRDGGGASPEGP